MKKARRNKKPISAEAEYLDELKTMIRDAVTMPASTPPESPRHPISAQQVRL